MGPEPSLGAGHICGGVAGEGLGGESERGNVGSWQPGEEMRAAQRGWIQP